MISTLLLFLIHKLNGFICEFNFVGVILLHWSNNNTTAGTIFHSKVLQVSGWLTSNIIFSFFFIFLSLIFRIIQTSLSRCQEMDFWNCSSGNMFIHSLGDLEIIYPLSCGQLKSFICLSWLSGGVCDFLSHESAIFYL